ncbi:zinc finger protein 518B [Echinops telfairi]|uniref:Zinc finger protein 518B n=1 Tax=Echinops telfairi TaxID=9371 RepID=A0ABM0J5E4_ECHTE|nr:zinc finger protein 518B [Echinops telfairi]
MQIKMMKDVGQPLYIPQVNDRSSSLTMSPKQPHGNSVAGADGREGHALLCQDPEREAAMMTIATCTKCKSIHRVPLQDFLLGTGQGQREDPYICFKCSLGVPPHRFHFVNHSLGTTHFGNGTDALSGPIPSKFKVRNFKPGKYYCDKCRFSTKDALQYRKHTLQHEEIKFICSHCSHISYTKGEFQRHLVKHTGIFPYQCEYCDYGAIRNDYIVKHRKRVHEKAGGGAKRSPKAVAKLELKGSSPSKPSPELSAAPAPKTLFQDRLPDPPARFPLPARKDGLPGVSLLPEAKARQKDVVCIPSRAAPASEPGEAKGFENKSVEVEVLSPTKEPVQPGMPLTVVAPAELVVPANCLAQLMDVKVVNGTQQLVLKLFPLEENGGPKAGGSGDGDGPPEALAKEKGSKTPERACSPERARPPTMEETLGTLLGFDGLQPAGRHPLGNVKWVRPYDFLTLNPRVLPKGEALLSPRRGQDAQESGHLYAHRTTLPPPTVLKGHRPPPPALKASARCGPGAAPNPFPYQLGASFPQDGWRLPSDLLPVFPLRAAPPVAPSFPGERGLLPSSETGLEPSGELSIPLKMFSSHWKPKDGQAGAAAKPGHAASPPKSEHSHLDLPGDAGPGPQPPRGAPAELKHAERGSRGPDPDGPVISSVFSLSSGSQNVPESIRWTSSTSKIKSIELLRQKIAQLIESCGRPSALAAGGAPRQRVARAEKEAPGASSEAVQEISVSLTGPGVPAGAPPDARDDGGGCGLTREPAKDCSAAEAERSLAEKAVAAPVLIPKGAVLRVLNSSEDAHVIEATCEAPVSLPCSDAQVVNPIPLCPPRQTDSDSQAQERGPVDAPQSLEPPSRPKPKKESAVGSSAPSRKTVPPHRQQGSRKWGKPRRLLSRNLTMSRSKTKQVSSSKRKSRSQAHVNHCLKDPSIFQVARHLRLIAVKPDQLIKCPRRNQPVIVLNHPDVDSPEVTNVMKVINKYKGNVLKVVLSERTRCQLCIRRHQVRLTYQDEAGASRAKRQTMLKMKLKKVHKNNYQVVDSLAGDSAQCIFKCWFCGRLYEDQEEWMSHGQRHLIEATRDWDILSSKGT